MRHIRSGGISVALLLLLVIGCTEQAPEEKHEAEVATEGDSILSIESEGTNGIVTLESGSTSGRVQLPTYRTPAPDLWITMPEGFSVRVDTMLTYDIMVVARNDDPLLDDSTRIPEGMLRIIVSDSAIRLPLPGKDIREQKSVVGDYPGIWRSSTVTIPSGEAYVSYEMIADDYFARTSPEQEVKDLRLHLYIGGKDSVVTGQLLEAVTTISIKP